jgi:hypothetical protein
MTGIRRSTARQRAEEAKPRQNINSDEVPASAAAVKRVCLYLRVSTVGNGQTTENQRRELEAVAARSGWRVVRVFEDNGVRGS